MRMHVHVSMNKHKQTHTHTHTHTSVLCLLDITLSLNFSTWSSKALHSSSLQRPRTTFETPLNSSSLMECDTALCMPSAASTACRLKISIRDLRVDSDCEKESENTLVVGSQRGGKELVSVVFAFRSE